MASLPSVFVPTRRAAFDEAVEAFDAAGVPLGAEVLAALIERGRGSDERRNHPR